MANITTVTRPYAKAVLALAKEENSYAAWTNMLQFLSDVATDALGYKVLSNLAMSPGEKVAFICDIGKDVLNEQAKNLVKTLARGKRLLILPELFSLYEQLREQAEGLVVIDLTVAQDVDRAEFDQIAAICKKSFAGQVNLHEKVDPNLISGGKAQIGNRVVDASIHGRLAAMRNLLRK